MNGSRRRLSIWVLVVALAGCQTTPPATVGPTSVATPAGTPVATALSSSPTATVTPSSPATSVDLPDGFDAIAWASMPPVTGDEDTFTVSIGVLGKPATATRTFVQQPSASADGGAVLVPSDAGTEIVDAATGRTISTFDPEALHLSLANVDSNDGRYAFAPRRFVSDVARGFLYDMSSNETGVRLRRFDLHGEHATLLAVLAPDPGKELWAADFVVASDGTVIAMSCPPQDASGRCRLYVVPAGGDGPASPRLLPASTPRLCFLAAANTTNIVGSSYDFCGADGGEPPTLPFMTINRSTLKATEIEGSSGLAIFGMLDDSGSAAVGNLQETWPNPSVYPAIGVVVKFDDVLFPVDRYVEAVDDPESVTPYEGWIWAIRGRGVGWTLLEGFGPAYVTCFVDPSRAPATRCPAGVAVLEIGSERFELPPGTWGETVSPFGFPPF